MKKLYKLFVFVVLLGFTFNVFAAPTSNIFRTLLPETDSTYNIGSNLVRWANGYFDNLDTATITISASSAGNITIKKADPCLIYDVTTATDTDFWTGVTEDAGGDDDDLFQIGDGTTCGANPFLTINTSGNVGIGTTAPLALADFRKNVDTSTTWWTDAVSGLNVQNDHATGDAILKLKGITTGIGRIVYGVASATDKLIFSSRESAGTTAESVTFDNNGNVGIGTTGPGQKLSVAGTFGILEGGATPTKYSIFQGGDQAIDLTYTLPTAYPAVSGYVLSATDAGVMSWIVNGAGSGATTALDNLASVAINTTLVSDTDNTDALGTTAIAWSDLFLGNGSVITWNSAPSTPDLTLTHSAETLTFAGGTIALGTATATGGLTGNVTGNVSGTSATVTGAAQAAITTAVNLPWTGMKPGTDGEIPTFDSSGNPAFVAAGTATHVLTSNGAGAAPTFQAAGGGSPMTLLVADSGSSGTISSAPLEFDNVAITGLTAKDTLKIFLTMEDTVQGTSGVALTNSTDSVSLTGDLGNIITNAEAQFEINIRQAQSAATKIITTFYGHLDNNSTEEDGQVTATFTQNWTGSWTLSLRSVSATNGGTVKWSWSVYKIAGQ